jgi:hypothetical protein
MHVLLPAYKFPLAPPRSIGSTTIIKMAQELSWEGTQQLIYSPVSSDIGPSLAVYNGRIYAGWKGSGGDQRMWCSNFDGTVWSQQTRLSNGESTVGPSLATFRGSLWAICKGSGNDRDLWYSSFDGTSWAGWRRTGGGTNFGGALAVFHGVLYMVYGDRDNEGIWYRTFDGSSWCDFKAGPSASVTGARPSLAVCNDSSGHGQKLVVAWRGLGEDETIYYSTFDGSSWTPKQPIPNAASNDGPALILFRNALYAAWRGPGEDERIYYSWFDGTLWVQPIPLATSFVGSMGPAMVVFNDQLYLAWKGRQGDSRIWWTRASAIIANLKDLNAPIANYGSKPMASAPVESNYDRNPPIPPQAVRNQATESIPGTNEVLGSASIATPLVGSEEIGGKSLDSDDYGFSDIKKGVKKGVTKGKGELSEMWSKIRHK